MAPLAPLLAAVLTALPARAAERVEPISTEAPLSPATPQLGGPGTLAAGTLALAQSVIPAADGAMPFIETKGQAWASATPQAYAQAPIAQGTLVAARPYFAVALERAEIEPRLVSRLAEYLSAPGRHPGPQDEIYHGLHHTYDVAALAARLTESPEAGNLRPEQRALLVLAAALHDVDPRRDPGTPASVARTLEYISDDPETRQLVDAFGERYGFTPAQLKALIKATDFSPDPKQAELLAQQTNAALGESFRDADWAKTWARRLAFADKMASYVGDPAYADRQVRGLANEIKFNSLTLAEGSYAFLHPLSQSPDYALLPADLRANFEKVQRHYQDVAFYPEKYASQFPAARGPPISADALYARAAAAQPVSPALAAQLADFQKRGFTLLSAAGALDPAIAQAIIAAKAKENQRYTWELFERPGAGLRRSRPDYDGWIDNPGNVRAFVARLTELFKSAAPGENIVPAKVGLRLEFDSEGAVPQPHIDGRYATATVALQGPGTDVWDDGSGKVEQLRAKTGVVTAITARGRASRLGAPGTVHATPAQFRGRRLVLVINFEREDYNVSEDAEAEIKSARRTASVMRRFEAQNQPAAAAPKPEKKSILARLKDIFE